jgi:hypothetical protein
MPAAERQFVDGLIATGTAAAIPLDGGALDDLFPANGTFGDQVGATVAFDGDVAVVGAPGKTLDRGFGAGAVFVFRHAFDLGTSCAGARDCNSGFCVDGVCCDSACGGGAVDDCQACSAAAGSSPGNQGTCTASPPSYVCQVALGECAPRQTCDGTERTCPVTVVTPNGQACAGGGVCMEGVCSSGSTPSSPGPYDSGIAPHANEPAQPLEPSSGCRSSPAEGGHLAGAAMACLLLLFALARLRP